MSVEDNLSVIRRADHAFQTQDWERFLNLHAESVVVNSPGSAEPIKGREGLHELVKQYYAAFPDLNTKSERMFGQGNWVVSEEFLTGTNTGPMTGPKGEEIPPTNKPVRMNQALVFQVENGLIQEVHLYFDQLGMLTQLGLAPSE